MPPTSPSFEEWRPVTVRFFGASLTPFYEVSSFGRVRRTKTAQGTKAGKILRPWWCPTRNGEYLKVSIYCSGMRRSVFVHRLVALAFIPNPEGKAEVNHKDTDHSNNRKDNLSWMTRQENEDWKRFVRRLEATACSTFGIA